MTLLCQCAVALVLVLGFLSSIGVEGFQSLLSSSRSSRGVVKMADRESSSSGEVPPSKSVQIPRESWELSALLCEAAPDNRNIMVLCHGLTSSKDGSVVKAAREGLDYNTLAFDFSGNGESGGEWVYAGYQREVEDLRTVIEWLRTEGWTVEAILGHSKGAATVMAYGEQHGDVPVIFNVAGRFDTSQTPRSRFSEEQWADLDSKGEMLWRTFEGKDLYVRKEDFVERAALDLARTCSAVKERAAKGEKLVVHTIHGDADAVIPVKDAHSFMAALGREGGSSLTVVEGGSHSFNGSQEEMQKAVDAIASKLGVRSKPVTLKKRMES